MSNKPIRKTFSNIHLNLFRLKVDCIEWNADVRESGLSRVATAEDGLHSRRQVGRKSSESLGVIFSKLSRYLVIFSINLVDSLVSCE